MYYSLAQTEAEQKELKLSELIIIIHNSATSLAVFI